MDLTHPSHAVLGENRSRILMTLATIVDPTSGRRVHDLSGVNALRTTQRVLDGFVRVGLVDVRPMGAANLYSLNRYHALWPPLEELLATPARVESEISKILVESLADSTQGAALFGSFARRQATADSDIDILVVWKDDIDEERATSLLDDTAERIRRLTGNQVQLLALNPIELQRLAVAEDPLIASLREDARMLTPGTDIKQLLGTHG